MKNSRQQSTNPTGQQHTSKACTTKEIMGMGLRPHINGTDWYHRTKGHQKGQEQTFQANQEQTKWGQVTSNSNRVKPSLSVVTETSNLGYKAKQAQ
jgi:hypothetical protein